MDLKKIEKELLRALRGKLSQERLSARLGYKSNKIYKWESGLNQISWLEFVRLSQACRADPRRAVRKLLGYKGELEDTSVFLRHLLGVLSPSEAAAKTGLSGRFLVRCLDGKASPSFQEVMNIVDQVFGLLPEFVVYWAPREELVPTALQALNKKRVQKKAIGENPALEPAFVCLGLTFPQMSRDRQAQKMAELLQIPLSGARDLILRLIELGLAKDEKGAYRPMTSRLDTAGGLQDSCNIRRYWLDQMNRYLNWLSKKPADFKEDLSGHFFGYEVVAVTESASKEIAREYYAFYARLYSILEKDKGFKSRVQYIGTQILDLGNLAE